jgi:hypothetical protein
MNISLRNIFLIGIFLYLGAAFTSCNNTPKGVLSSGEMEDVLVDYHVARAIGENLPPTERYKQILYLNYVFAKHHITQAQFDSSLVWYSSHTEDFAKIYGKVTTRFRNEQKDLTEQISGDVSKKNTSSNLSANGDTANIWTGKPSYYCFTGAPSSSVQTFEISPDNNFKPRDVILWTIRCALISNQTSPQNCIMLIAVTYNNDSTIVNYRPINSSGIYKIRTQNNNLVGIRSIKGFICFGKPNTQVRSMMIVDQMNMVRIHVHTPIPPTTAPLKSAKADTAKKPLVNGNIPPPVSGAAISSSPTSATLKENQEAAAHAAQILQNQPMDASHPRPIQTNRNEIMKKLEDRTKDIKNKK